MNKVLDLVFPDITHILYSEKTLDDIRIKYIELLRNENSIYNILYANKLEESLNMLSHENLQQLEHEFHDLKEHLRTWSKDRRIHLLLKRRLKDWLGQNEKIQLFLSTGRPLDKILDILGFRIIVCSELKDTVESINLCYELQNEVIDFFIKKKHCIFLESEPKINTDFNHENHPDIIIPESATIYKGFEPNVKDYIRFPKKNGYQSLHTVARKPNGLTFEIQIRTYAMDLLAEHGTGAHTLYKNGRYSEVGLSSKIDFTKIHISGFTVLEDGNINDIVGLRKSVDPFNFL